jgi:pilus assembly protein CpaB
MARKPGAGGIIVLALIFGVITAFLLGAYLRKQADKEKENWQPVVVAALDIPERTIVKREMIQEDHYPKELIAENVFVKVSDIEGKMTKSAIKKKDQIRRTDILAEGEIPTLAIKVRPGMRAVAIGASEIIAVGTSIQPGDRVDIIATYQDPKTRQEMTKIILQNVPILMVNRGKTSADDKGGANSSMTLEVTPEQTELVTAAERSGTLRVTLRAVNGEEIVATPGVGARDLNSGPQASPEGATPPEKTPIFIVPPPSSAGRARPEIEIYRGTDQKTVTQ